MARWGIAEMKCLMMSGAGCMSQSQGMWLARHRELAVIGMGGGGGGVGTGGGALVVRSAPALIFAVQKQ